MAPVGSHAEALAGKTRALKKAWTTYPEMVEKKNTVIAAAEKMAAAAGTGLDGIRSNMGDFGGGCKGYHEKCRQPE